MITYQYGCGVCGAFDATYPMGEAPAQTSCVACDGPATRRFTPPLLARTPRPLADALEAGRSEPRVVGQVPSARRARPGGLADPRHDRLPRP